MAYLERGVILANINSDKWVVVNLFLLIVEIVFIKKKVLTLSCT